MPQYLYNSKVWIDYLEEHFNECTDFFKFAMVWMSFNSYYSSRYQHVKGEYNQIVEFVKDNEIIYSELENNTLKSILCDFEDTGWLFSQPGKRDCVADERSDSNRKTFFNETHNSCEDFFKVIYRIRCNFFHGSKDVSDSGNKKLIQWAYKYLNIFWRKFLEEHVNFNK